MSHYTDAAAGGGGNAAQSPGSQAAMAAAAMSFSMDQRKNDSSAGASTAATPVYRRRKQQQAQSQAQAQSQVQPQGQRKQPYTPRLATDQPSFPQSEMQVDASSRSPTNRHYRQPPERKIASPQTPLPASSASSVVASSASTLSPSSQNNKSLWNDLNHSSSTTALAAAASIAKMNPSSLISNTTSPKLVRKPIPTATHSMIHSTLRKSPQQTSTASIPRYHSSASTTSVNTREDTRPQSNNGRNLPRKPPPPSRDPTNENLNSSTDIASTHPSSTTTTTPAAAAAANKSFDMDKMASTSSLFQFPLQHNNSYAVQSNVSIPYPHSKNSSPNSTPQPAQNGFHSSSELYPAPELHRRSLSKSQKLTNFLTPKTLKDEIKSQRLYNHQLSNSTTTLPSQIQQLSLNEPNSFTSDLLSQPMTAPTMYASPNGSTDYFSHQQLQPEDFYSNPNMSASKVMNNNNNSSSNIYQQATAVPSQQLVFRTTLRNGDKKGGFGRSKKSKTEFNEDKPWKNHERGNLNTVTADEKKRYEGVFAANKGLYINLDLRLTDQFKLKTVKVGDSVTSEPERTLADFVNTYSTPSERIHGLVVRDIWQRSRLDQETLKKMWSLVLDDRKRRWIKSISNGDTEWLLVEDADVDADVDVDVDDVATVNNDVSRIKEHDTARDADGNPIFKEGFTLDQAVDTKNDTPIEQPPVQGVIPRISITVNPEDDHEENTEYNGSDVSIKTKETQENEIDDILESPEQEDDQNSDMKSDRQVEVQTIAPQDQHRKRSDGLCDLLDTDRNLFDDGTLTCDEFIVGMWLVDQCLYGRKIPKIVPITVWETIGVDWTVSSYGAYGNYPYHFYHPHVPGINGVSDIVGMGIKKGKKGGKNRRHVFKKVIGI